jgi:DNA gyrase subunit B
VSLLDLRRGETRRGRTPPSTGILEYVRFLNQAKQALHSEPISFRGEQERRDQDRQGPVMATALRRGGPAVDRLALRVAVAVHQQRPPDRRRHAPAGPSTALTRTVNAYAQEKNLLKETKGQPLSGDDVREGLTYVISLRHPAAQYDEHRPRSKLASSDVCR